MMLQMVIDLLNVATLGLALCFYNPLSVFLSNRVEFRLRPAAVSAWLLVTAIVVSIVLGSILALIIWFSPSAGRVLYYAMTALALSALLCGQIVVSNCAEEAGRRIDWNKYARISGWTLAGLALIAAVLALCIMDKRYHLAVLAIINVAFAVSLFSFVKPSTELRGRFIFKDIEVFSKNHPNLVIFVSDSFSTDAFRKILTDEPALAARLKGFTFFSDTTSACSTTSLSVPVVLTGERYMSGETNAEYLRRSYTSAGSIPKMLKSLGYESQAIPACEPVVYKSSEVFSNFIDNGEADVDVHRQLAVILDYGLFRGLPVALKPMIYRSQQWLVISWMKSILAGVEQSLPLDFPDGEAFFRRAVTNKLRPVVTAGGIFKFVHLGGPHPPFRIDEQGRPSQPHLVIQDNASYNRQAKHCLHEFLDFMDTLRKSGVADNTLLFFLGDHSYLTEPSRPAAGMGPEDFLKEAQQLGRPLMLVFDPAKQHQDLNESRAQAELSDIPSTIDRFVGSKVRPGLDLLNTKDAVSRTRYFGYLLQPPTWDSDRMPAQIENYEVTGDSSRIASWRWVGRTVPSVKSVESIPVGCVLTVADLRRLRERKVVEFNGIYDSNQEWNWSCSAVNTYFTLDDTSPDSMTACVIVENVLYENLTVGLLANGVGKDITMPLGLNFLEIEFPVTAGKTNQLTFTYSKLGFLDYVAAAPIGREVSARFIGVAICSNDKRPDFGRHYGYALAMQDQLLNVGQSSFHDILLSGWKDPERASVWTTGKSSLLWLPTKDLVLSNQRLEVGITLKPLSQPGVLDAQTVRVFAGEHLLADLWVDEHREYQIMVPASRITGTGVQLKLEIPTATTPKKLGYGSDETVLGVQMFSIRLAFARVVTPGERVLFGRNNLSAGWLVSGWKNPEDGFVWSAGLLSSIAVPIVAASSGTNWLRVVMQLSPLKRAGLLDAQRISVTVAGKHCAELLVDRFGQYGFWVNRADLTCDELKMQLDIPLATSLKSLGMGDDETILGVQMAEMSYQEEPGIRLGEKIKFGNGEQSAVYCTQGWKSPENGFVWSTGNLSALLMPLSDAIDADDVLDIKLELSPLLKKGVRDWQRIIVLAGGKQVVELNANAYGTYTIEVPGSAVIDGLLELVLDIPTASSLKDLGLDDNPTVLGIQLVSLVINHKGV
jgi:hypothetical protein